MATENKRMAQRIDTLTNWTTNNPLIQPGEVCFIQGTTDYRVNVSSTATNFNNCQLFKGSDTASTPNNSKITLVTGSRKPDAADEEIGFFNLDQASAKTIPLPNFVTNAKIDYPISDVKTLVQNDWTAEQSLRTKIPHCIPTDLVICIIREWAAKLEAAGVTRAMSSAQDAIITALGLSNLEA